MFLRKATNKKNGRTYLSIVHGYYDKKAKNSKAKTIKSLGYLDLLEKEYDDPIAHFTEVAQQMNEEYKKENAPVSITFNLSEEIDKSTTNRKNFGYAALSKIYHELKIDKFLTNRQRHTNEEYSANSIMKLLVFARMLFPASKRKTFNNKEMFFEKTNFSLDDIYRCLGLFNKHKDELQLWMHERIKEKYNRNTNLVYYDVTNYYFEINEPDDMRKKGISKEKRSDPIVQMGLFIDDKGIPITYKLFPGNTADCSTLIPMLSNMQRKYSLGRVIVVADRGITSGDNIYYTLSTKNGYVLSYSVRGSSEKFKNYVLSDEGYRKKVDGFKIKSRLEPREIWVTMTNGKKKKVTVHEKQVVFYSPKYALKARKDREKAVKKAQDLIRHPSKYNKSSAYGAAKYIKNLTFDSKTGELLEDAKKALYFNEERLREEEKFDGYYAIVTSEHKETDKKILDIYRGLWKIEESFKVTKSDLEARPVYLSDKDHIDAHFLTCFISLVIARLLEYRLKGKYSIPSILESLSRASCSHIKENFYLFDYDDEILEATGKELEIDFSKKFMPLKEIKKILGYVKK
ncbi:MAG TPA: IS1634 family transposase [Flavobacteriaceae bacterium]|nr:IS1634 family transposase [Flavobacteriaceae bacterium]